MKTIPLRTQDECIAYLKTLGDQVVDLPSGGEMTSAAADAVSMLAGEHASVFARTRNQWSFKASELVALFDFSQYTVTVKRDPRYYGDASKEEAHAIASKIGAALELRYPGITVRYCDMIGHGNQDVTAGPDPGVCDDIDDSHCVAKDAALQDAPPV